MSYQRINFTKRAIGDLPTPKRIKPKSPARAVYRDKDIPWLELRVTDRGSKTFSVRMRVKNGNVERMTIGKFPAVTVERAREEAKKHGGAFAVGNSPAADRRKKVRELTIEELYGLYAKRFKLDGHTRIDHKESLYRLHLSHWAKRKASGLSGLYPVSRTLC
jgi:hypothetical protein